LSQLGYDLDAEKLNAIFKRFKEVAERKKGGLEDDDLEALVSDNLQQTDDSWVIQDLQVITGMNGIPTATVTMLGPDGISRYVATTGIGTVDCVFRSIDKLMGIKVNLENYDLKGE
jgi:2-isopropylmalate synthase|tara:strand:- start:389 stop:736 length:348 start_codon:yes stop_codon:yes gene_type:complete